jgi:hypothetical protein
MANLSTNSSAITGTSPSSYMMESILFEMSVAPGVINAPPGPGREFLQLEDRKRSRALIEHQPPQQDEEIPRSHKRRKTGPSDPETGSLAFLVPVNTWRCSDCFTNTNSLDKDTCVSCHAPRPTGLTSNAVPFKMPGLFADDTGGTRGSITQNGFYFMSPPLKAAVEPDTSGPFVRKRIRANRPTRSTKTPVPIATKYARSSRTPSQGTRRRTSTAKTRRITPRKSSVA